VARPKGTSKLDLEPQLASRIITFIKAGSYLETAAAAAGVNSSTLHRWLKRGAQGEEPFAGFRSSVEAALAEAELRDLARIDRAAETQWQAAAWKLERRNPKKWGHRVDLTGTVDGAITHANAPGEALKVSIDLSTLTLEELSAYERTLAVVAEAAVRSARGTDPSPVLPVED
jgi:transposase